MNWTASAEKKAGMRCLILQPVSVWCRTFTGCEPVLHSSYDFSFVILVTDSSSFAYIQ